MNINLMTSAVILENKENYLEVDPSCSDTLGEQSNKYIVSEALTMNDTLVDYSGIINNNIIN